MTWVIIALGFVAIAVIAYVILVAVAVIRFLFGGPWGH